jgi:choline dehydrogenase
MARRTIVQDETPYLRGRGLGGSSVINGQIAIRPPLDDFDRWAADGCVGWSSADVLDDFRRIEDDLQFGDREYHGHGGPIPVFRNPQSKWGSVDLALRAAGLDAGHPWHDDVNAPGAMGVSPYPINSRESRRVSTHDAYLEPGRALRGLRIQGGTLVDRILFDGDRAVGVRVVVAGTTLTFTADRIVLAAGAVHSPTILQRSGVGPERTLRSLGIAVRVDLPVGVGLQDHPLAVLPIALNPRSRPRGIDERHANCCIRYSSDTPEALADMMIVACNSVAADEAGLRAPASYGFVGVWVNDVHSRGELAITSTDPDVQPRIDERMLSDQRDVARLRSGIRHLTQLAGHDAFAELTEARTDEPAARAAAGFSAPTPAELEDDAALDRYLLRTVGDAAHVTSTCRMGAPDAATTVVDPSGRVLGIDGLLVADASILPGCPRANTHLACVVVGEHLARTLIARTSTPVKESRSA